MTSKLIESSTTKTLPCGTTVTTLHLTPEAKRGLSISGSGIPGPDEGKEGTNMTDKSCTNFSPPWFTGRWRDWHRGHGCDKDDGMPRTPEGEAEISAGERILARMASKRLRSATMTDDRPKRIDLTDTTKEHGRTLVHLLGYYGDGGENESVISVTADLSPGENFPVCGRVFVGTPRKSPLLEGYFPDLGGFACSPDDADRLADEIKAAAAAARAAMAASEDDLDARAEED